MAEGESKYGDEISPGVSTNDGKSSRDGKPDQSESANGVEAQFRGSGPGCIKETDPYKGTGAIPKRPKQDNSRNPETSSSKDTLAEETDETEILPVQGEPENNVDLYCKTRGKTNMNHCLGLVLGSDGL